ncbi:MAG: CinA family protein [Pseudomonadota bacterium]
MSRVESHSIEGLARAVIDAAAAKHLMVATAESCTGGLIAAALTDIAGSSAVVDRGFVTYSNEAKQDMLGVTPSDLLKFGAVSSEVATAMAMGALERSRAACTVSVTGIAGPGGGSAQKPVGLVYIATANALGTRVEKCLFADTHEAHTRQAVREVTVSTALKMLLESMSSLSQ